MASEALRICIAYLIVSVLDTYILSWQCLTRPLVVGPIAGLILGDVKTGIILGASLESIFMGISAIGGSIPSDWTSATFITVAFTILSGQNTEAGLALAIPIGTVMQSITGLMMTFWSSLAPYWEKLAVSGKIKQFISQSLIVSTLMNTVSAVVMFFAVAYGTGGLDALLAALPAWVMTGLGAASGMMIAIGIAILTSMIWSGSVGVFFFLGYVMVKFLNLSTLPIAIIGIVIAVTIFLQDKDVIEVKNSIQEKLGKGSQSSDEKGFFA